MAIHKKIKKFISKLGRFCNEHPNYKAPYNIYLLLCKMVYQIKK